MSLVKRKWIRYTIAALPIAWFTAGDIFLRIFGVRLPTEIAKIHESIYGPAVVSPAVVWMGLHLIAMKDKDIYRYIVGPIVIAISTMPITFFYAIFQDWIAHPALLPMGVLFTPFVLASKMVIWIYWWELTRNPPQANPAPNGKPVA